MINVISLMIYIMREYRQKALSLKDKSGNFDI